MKFRVERDTLADAVTWVARGLPARPPWAHAYLVPLNTLRYRTPWGRARLDSWGERVRARLAELLPDEASLGNPVDMMSAVMFMTAGGSAAWYVTAKFNAFNSLSAPPLLLNGEVAPAQLVLQDVKEGKGSVYGIQPPAPTAPGSPIIRSTTGLSGRATAAVTTVPASTAQPSVHPSSQRAAGEKNPEHHSRSRRRMSFPK